MIPFLYKIKPRKIRFARFSYWLCVDVEWQQLFCDIVRAVVLRCGGEVSSDFGDVHFGNGKAEIVFKQTFVACTDKVFAEEVVNVAE